MRHVTLFHKRELLHGDTHDGRERGELLCCEAVGGDDDVQLGGAEYTPRWCGQGDDKLHTQATTKQTGLDVAGLRANYADSLLEGRVGDAVGRVGRGAADFDGHPSDELGAECASKVFNARHKGQLQAQLSGGWDAHGKRPAGRMGRWEGGDGGWKQRRV